MRRLSRQRNPPGEIVLNVIPLIDVVFFLLVFYVMASSFLREETLQIVRPNSMSATPAEAGFVSVAVTRDGTIQCAGPASLATLPTAVRSELARVSANRCVVVADGAVPVQTVLAVMDACRLGGANTVEIAASSEAP